MGSTNGTTRTLDELDLNRVAVFVRIAEAKGVSAAAARAKLPKSSVSRALTQLEDELGTELIVRRSKGFQLTGAGQVFYDAAAKGIAAVHDARAELRSDGSVPRGSLRVAAPPGIATLLVSPTIVKFVRRYPGVDVELSVTAARVDPIRDGFDVILCVGPLEDSSARVRRIGAMDAGIFASKEYLAERGVPRRPSDLAKHDCILQTRSPLKNLWTLRGPGRTTDVTVRGRVAVDDQFAACAAATSGGGLVVLPLHMVTRDPAAAPLQRVLSDWVIAGEPAQIVFAASRHVPLRVSMFCEALVTAMQGCHPDDDA
jgi:DNA-binding transcriptional LysR family regulator